MPRDLTSAIISAQEGLLKGATSHEDNDQDDNGDDDSES